MLSPEDDWRDLPVPDREALLNRLALRRMRSSNRRFKAVHLKDPEERANWEVWCDFLDQHDELDVLEDIGRLYGAE